jgi:NAD(P)-dependent dehydrogenase (short-subunit alcohol dehydrogenase family)
MKLENHVALITGSGSGIGKGIALAFARQGADIALNDIDLASAEKVAKMIEDLGRSFLVLKGDISQSSQVSAIVSHIMDEWGKIDILVNNAGIFNEMVPTHERSEEEWSRVVDIHLKGAFLCSKYAGRAMIEKRAGGNVINVASITGLAGFPNRSAYGPAKSGIINLTKTMAVEWAPYGIRVNAIAPGYILTEGAEKMFLSGEVKEEPLKKRIPLGRLGTVEEVARVALFLASEESSYITGETITVDGGWMAYGYL